MNCICCYYMNRVEAGVKCICISWGSIEMRGLFWIEWINSHHLLLSDQWAVDCWKGTNLVLILLTEHTVCARQLFCRGGGWQRGRKRETEGDRLWGRERESDWDDYLSISVRTAGITNRSIIDVRSIHTEHTFCFAFCSCHITQLIIILLLQIWIKRMRNLTTKIVFVPVWEGS